MRIKGENAWEMDSTVPCKYKCSTNVTKYDPTYMTHFSLQCLEDEGGQEGCLGSPCDLLLTPAYLLFCLCACVCVVLLLLFVCFCFCYLSWVSFVCLFSFLSFLFSLAMLHGLWVLCCLAEGWAWASRVGPLSPGHWATREFPDPANIN